MESSPYDTRPSEKVLLPTLVLAGATVVSATTKKVGSAVVLTLAACTATTAVLGWLARDSRFEQVRGLLLARKASSSGDGDDGDRQSEHPPALTSDDDHPPD